jgi:GTP cyclohydrolase I
MSQQPSVSGQTKKLPEVTKNIARSNPRDLLLRIDRDSDPEILRTSPEFVDEPVSYKTEIALAMQRVLSALGEDVSRDGLLKTPERVARSLEFLTSGYHQDGEQILTKALFDVDYDEMVIVRDIEVFSMCEHHMLPFYGKAHVAYLPNGKVVGLSKIPRLVDVFSRRLQVQERLTTEIGENIDKVLRPRGVAVVVEAVHFCMMMRGVEKQHSSTNTLCMLGEFKNNPDIRKEFLSQVCPHH